MSLVERARTAWVEFQGIGRFLSGLPVLNPLGQWSCARLLNELAEAKPHQLGLVFQGERWTWQQLRARANQYAHFAIHRRLRRGDVVAVLMDNRPDYLCSVAGLNRAGVVSALINTHLTGAALAHAITAAKPKALLLGREHAKTVTEVLRQLPGLSKTGNVWVLADGDHRAAVSGLHVIDAEVAACSPTDPRRRALPKTREPMCYIYTSGTTGLPKAAIISNLRWLEAAVMFGRVIGEMMPADVLYLTLPLYHSAAMLCGWGSVLVSGATLALRRRFSASQFWDDVRAFDATVFLYIGELCRYLLAQPWHPGERRHRLRLCMGNGLRADAWKKFQSRFRIPLIREYYGATEGNLGLVNLEGRPGMIGRLVPGVAIVKCDPVTGALLRNARGRCEPVAVGERGLLLGWINAFMKFDGYLDRAATRKKIVRGVFYPGDAYFNTGDLVQLHANGWVSFADRIGDTFRWKGENVSTQEVAETLTRAAGLRDATVYGVPVPGAEGRAGMASVVVTDGFDLDAFARFVSDQLPSYQRPHFLRLVADLQVTGTFKHQKVDYRTQGYDPAAITDPLYYLEGGRYVPLDADLYQRLSTGEVGPR